MLAEKKKAARRLIQLEEDVWERLIRLSGQMTAETGTRVSVTALVRRAVDEFLDNQQARPPKTR